MDATLPAASVMAERADGFHVKVVLNGIAFMVVVFVAPVARGPFMTTVGARKSVRVGQPSRCHQVVHAVAGTRRVTAWWIAGLTANLRARGV